MATPIDAPVGIQRPLAAQLSPTALPWVAWAAVITWWPLRDAIQAALAGHSDNLMLLATLGVVFWVERRGVMSSLLLPTWGRPGWGALVLLLGSCSFVLGRSSGSVAVETWGVGIMGSALVLSFGDERRTVSAGFIALACSIIVALGRIAPAVLSTELAVQLAGWSEQILRATGVAITAVGVKLYVGPYVAEVTQACSGLNSMFALSAMAVVYLRNQALRSAWLSVVLVLMVIPVAIASNLARVLLLVLSMIYMGDRFTQGLFHNVAGLLSFAIAVILLATITKLGGRREVTSEMQVTT